MSITAHVVRKFNIPDVINHDSTLLSCQARFAMDLAARWGMVAGLPDGEDSSGRQQLRIMTPVELADRAISITELMFKRMEENGFTAQLDDWETLVADYEKEIEKD